MVLYTGHKRYGRRQAMQMKVLTDAEKIHSRADERATVRRSCMARRAFNL